MLEHTPNKTCLEISLAFPLEFYFGEPKNSNANNRWLALDPHRGQPSSLMFGRDSKTGRGVVKRSVILGKKGKTLGML